jgi:hypothetical protein
MNDSDENFFDTSRLLEDSLLAGTRLPSDFVGQKLFIQGEDWHNNAMLGWTHWPWDIHAAGYKDAADALVQALDARRATLDTVIYPQVYAAIVSTVDGSLLRIRRLSWTLALALSISIPTKFPCAS